MINENLLKKITDLISQEIFTTPSKEVAFQALKILGHNYCLVVNSSCYAIHLVCSKQGERILFSLEKILLEEKKVAEKLADNYLFYLEDLRFKAFDVCRTVSSVISNQEKDKENELKKKIELEEEALSRIINRR